MTPLLRSIIMPSHSPLPNLGFADTTTQSFYKKSRLSKGFKLNGGPVPAQLPLTIPPGPLGVGTALLQLVWTLMTSSSLIQSLGPPHLFFLVTVIL